MFSRLPPAQTSKSMELVGHDCKICRVRTRCHHSECTSSIYLTRTCLCYWVWMEIPPNSHRANICKLLDNANSSHQSATAGLIGAVSGSITASSTAGIAELWTVWVAELQTTMARVTRSLGRAVHRESHTASTTCCGSDSSIPGHTRACVHTYGQNLPSTSCR